jgi:hypothetical protein
MKQYAAVMTGTIVVGSNYMSSAKVYAMLPFRGLFTREGHCNTRKCKTVYSYLIL